MLTGLQLHKAHPRMGILVVLLLLGQPVLGYVHHIRFIKTHHQSIYTTAHIWYGRVLLVLGLLNGGLGLRLAGQRLATQVVYGLAAGLVLLVWVGSIFLARRNATTSKQNQSEFRLATLDEDEDEDEFRD